MMTYFTRKNRATLLTNPWYSVHQDTITSQLSHEQSTYFVIDFKGESVGAIIVNDKNELLFVKAIRYVTDKISLEIPAGGIEAGEDIYAAATRECMEETGYNVSITKKLVSFYTSNGVSNQTYNIVLGHLAETNQSDYLKNETIDTVWLSAKEALNKINNGEITDGPTITGILLVIQQDLSC